MKGHIKQRAPGSWTIWLELGKDADGKRKQKTVTIRGTKRQAQTELNRLLHELDSGTFTEPNKVTLADFLRRWLKAYAEANVAGKTYERYEGIVTKALIPALGRHQIAKLSALQIQEYYSELLRTGRMDGSGGLSPTTVRQYHVILRQALQHAVQWGLLARNPGDLVEAPQASQNEQKALDAAGALRLLEELEGSPLRLIVLVAVASGFRRGELLALRWSDVDLATGIVAIQRSLEVTKAGLAFKPPKTPESRRSVKLPDFAVEALVGHKGIQEARQTREGSILPPESLVFSDDDGAPLNPDQISSRYAHWLARRPHLPKVRFQDLRHSNATILFQQGEHPKVVSERLGHSSVKITMDVYSHVLPGMQEAAAAKLDSAFIVARESAPTPPPSDATDGLAETS